MSSNIETDKELVSDFFDELMDAYNDICTTVNDIKNSKEEYPDVSPLFRSLHSIKSNLRMMQLVEMSNLIHELEEIINDIRDKKFHFLEELGGVIVLTIEELQIACQNVFNDKSTSDQFKIITNVIEHINELPASEKESAIKLALEVFDPIKSSYFSPDKTESKVTTSAQIDGDENVVDNNFYLSEDLYFFENIAKTVNKRLNIPKSKMDIINKVAMAINQINKDHLDRDQLQAAICLSHFGKSIMPKSLVKKDLEKLTEDELAEFQNHPIYAYDVLSKNKYWKEAAQYVLQSQENYNGSGYPRGLKGDEISLGAQIISISIYFADLIVTKSIKKVTARGIISVVMDVNEQEGIKYGKHILQLFNTAIKHLHRSHKL